MPINGWLNLHKPLGITSAKAVAIVKKHFHPMKIGHAGTLDPLASGVLPLALGEATKTVQFCMDNIKEYEFTVKWGEATSTGDVEGEIIQTSDVRPTLEQIQKILPQFIGEIMQAPPQYSAIKINGKRAYDLARSGEVVEMKARKVMIGKIVCGWSFIVGSDKQLLRPTINDQLQTSTFTVSCGKGTYVRSLATDIAVALGTVAHVTSLVRTKVGNFAIENAILLEDIEKTVYKDGHSGVLLPVDTVLDDIQVLEFTPEEAARIRHGQKVLAAGVSIGDAPLQDIFVIKCNGTLVAVCEFGEGLIKPLRVFNL